MSSTKTVAIVGGLCLAAVAGLGAVSYVASQPQPLRSLTVETVSPERPITLCEGDGVDAILRSEKYLAEKPHGFARGLTMAKLLQEYCPDERVGTTEYKLKPGKYLTVTDSTTENLFEYKIRVHNVR